MPEPRARANRRRSPLTNKVPRPAAPLDGLRLLTLQEAGPRLGLSYWATRDLVLRGHLPCVRLPGKHGKNLRRILIDVRDLEEFVNEHRTALAMTK